MSYNQARRMQRRESPKSRLIALLLCLFLGYLGVHRFYVGKIASGILYLCTGGLFYIGWFIDFIVILAGGFRDSNGLPVTSWEEYTPSTTASRQAYQPQSQTTQTSYQTQSPYPPKQSTQSTRKDPSKYKYCPTCGVANEKGATYCRSCGSILDV